MRQTDSVEDVTLPKLLVLLLLDARVLRTFSLLFDRSVIPRDGRRLPWSFFVLPRGLGGDGERFRRFEVSAKLDRKAGSSRGGCATETRDVFLCMRLGDGGCWKVGVDTVGGEVDSPSSIDFSSLVRASSE